MFVSRRALALTLLFVALAQRSEGLELSVRRADVHGEEVPLSAQPDLSGVELCNKGYLRSPGKRYSDRSDRLASLRECGPCSMNKPGAPYLYIKEGNEGMGSRMHETIAAMAVAAKDGMNLGGLISRGICHKSHEASVLKTTNALIKTVNGNDIFTEEPPVFDAVYRGVKDMEDNFVHGPDYRDGANVLILSSCIACELDTIQFNITRYMEPRFLETLRHSATGLLSLPPTFALGRPSVAVHVRRGDVSEFDGKRGTPDSWYFQLLDRIKQSLPTADVHIFSSLEKLHESSEFDGYRKRNMTVHLDDTDLLEPWSQFAQADVLVMAKSSFSHVPGLLNPNCVIYEEYWHLPQQEWITVQQSADGQRTVDDAKLEACLGRIKVARGLAGKRN